MCARPGQTIVTSCSLAVRGKLDCTCRAIPTKPHSYCSQTALSIFLQDSAIVHHGNSHFHQVCIPHLSASVSANGVDISGLFRCARPQIHPRLRRIFPKRCSNFQNCLPARPSQCEPTRTRVSIRRSTRIATTCIHPVRPD